MQLFVGNLSHNTFLLLSNQQITGVIVSHGNDIFQGEAVKFS